jgi:hypothetical protein
MKFQHQAPTELEEIQLSSIYPQEQWGSLGTSPWSRSLDAFIKQAPPKWKLPQELVLHVRNFYSFGNRPEKIRKDETVIGVLVFMHVQDTTGPLAGYTQVVAPLYAVTVRSLKPRVGTIRKKIDNLLNTLSRQRGKKFLESLWEGFLQMAANPFGDTPKAIAKRLDEWSKKQGFQIVGWAAVFALQWGEEELTKKSIEKKRLPRVFADLGRGKSVDISESDFEIVGRKVQFKPKPKRKARKAAKRTVKKAAAKKVTRKRVAKRPRAKRTAKRAPARRTKRTQSLIDRISSIIAEEVREIADLELEQLGEDVENITRQIVRQLLGRRRI